MNLAGWYPSGQQYSVRLTGCVGTGERISTIRNDLTYYQIDAGNTHAFSRKRRLRKRPKQLALVGLYDPAQ